MPARRGVWIFVALLAVCGVATMVAAWGLRGAGHSGAPLVLVFEPPEELAETPPSSFVFSFRYAHRGGLTVHDVVAAITRAARDPKVEGLHLRVSSLDWGWGKLAEVRDAIQRFAATGKPVVAVLDGGGDPEYFLASVATTIVVLPSATLQIDGLSMSAIFYAELLSKLDIRPNFARSGRFKSGVEPYTRSGLSAPSREALEALLDDHYRLFVDSLASARGVAPETMRALVDRGPFDAEEALAAGLVDTLLYEPAADALMESLSGRTVERVELSDYAERTPRHAGPRVALVAAAGTIVSGQSRFLSDGEEGMGAETIREALEDARDRGARAIVLRIDSPGGEYGASDAIRDEVRRCAEEVPIVVSMSDFAASGGYLIAAPATRIVAQPTTITGSIGIYGGKLNLAGLYRKVGLGVETVSRGERADMMSSFRDFTPVEAERFQAQLERDYRDLLAHVARGRDLTLENADSLGQGRVWSGQAAFANGLVDTLGGLDVAIGIALAEAGIDSGAPYVLDVFPKTQMTWPERLLATWLEDSHGMEPVFQWSLPIPTFARWLDGTPLALLPCRIEVR